MVTLTSMARVRPRHVIFLAALLGGPAATVFGCSSSDNPPPASTGSGFDAALGDTSFVPTDAPGDGDASAADAADDRQLTDDGHCLNDQPAPTIDGGFDGGEGGVPVCPTTGDCAGYCADIVEHYKLGLAQVAVTCVLALPSCANPSDVRTCVDDALLASCKDNASPAYCTPLVKTCDPNAGGPGSNIDEPGCESFANGLSASGRDAFSACIESKVDAGTCASEILACTDQIRQ
jgi:hypothetical protein